MASPDASARRRGGRSALYAWALYDLANTTFSLNVVSRYLPLLVVEDLGGRDLDVSLAYSSAMIVVALTAPLLGALSDQSGRRLPFLALATSCCIAATACMGLGKPAALVLVLFAIVGAFGAGPFADRFGAKRRLLGALALWAVGLALASATPDKVGLWFVGPITGTALGATWASDRVLMFRLSPPESLGELYGIYGMVGRFAAITGPLLWGTVVYALEDQGALAYRAAIAALLVMLLAGAWVLRRVAAV